MKQKHTVEEDLWIETSYVFIEILAMILLNNSCYYYER